MSGTLIYERSEQGGVLRAASTPDFFDAPATPYYADRLRYLSPEGFSVSVGKSVTAPNRGVTGRLSGRHFLHFVHKGALTFNGVRVTAGQGFYCPPNQPHTIRSDGDDPAVMLWISAGGKEADRLFEAPLPTVFDLCGTEEILLLEQVLYCPRADFDPSGYFRGLLRMILSLRRPAPKGIATEEKHVANALSWLEDHPNATVEETAQALYLSRKYLSRLFKKYRGEPLREHLQRRRMETARALLRGGASVGDVAEALGYSDLHAFSHAFRGFYGIPPSRDGKDTPESR